MNVACFSLSILSLCVCFGKYWVLRQLLRLVCIKEKGSDAGQHFRYVDHVEIQYHRRFEKRNSVPKRDLVST